MRWCSTIDRSLASMKNPTGGCTMRLDVAGSAALPQSRQSGRCDMSRSTAPSSAHLLQEHYQQLGADYDDYLHYSDEFVRSLTSKMMRCLDLQEDDVLVDLGGGTGMYS